MEETNGGKSIDSPSQPLVYNEDTPPTEVAITLPVNGMVQPPTEPPSTPRGRMTNYLQYIQKQVMKAIFKHQFAWFFQQPLDTTLLTLPACHTIKPQPMDLGTIKKRLENKYYWCANECIRDFHTMFTNCYIYYEAEDQYVVRMTQHLERFFLSNLAKMPQVEVELEDN